MPLTSDGYNFTTNTYGGSAWRWSESHTFEYRNDEWYLVKLEESYYTGYISEDVSYTDSEGLTDISNEIVSIYICSMNMDGSNEKKIYNFENNIDDTENIPYIYIGFEIHKDKIVMYTYGDKETTYYRMNIDGSNVEYLGNINN